jgi:hypothetical protein
MWNRATSGVPVTMPEVCVIVGHDVNDGEVSPAQGTGRKLPLAALP